MKTSEEQSQSSPESDVVLREARMADYEGLCLLFAELDELHRVARPDIFVVPQGPRRTREYIEAQIGSETSTIFVAERASTLVGFAHVMRKEMIALPIRPAKVYAEVENLVVASAHRRSGIGLKLLGEAQSWACSRGIDVVHIGVFAFNCAAIALYKRAGFSIDTMRMSKRSLQGNS